jgi:hypothetical protein
MKKDYSFYLLSVVFCFVSISAFTQSTKTKVLVLGTYHMNNPGLDKFNMKVDDVTSAKRQKEIAEFVNALAAFKPTKICLEYPHANDLKN